MKENNYGTNSMDHVAYMRKSWGMVEKIRSGEKVIESRWYKIKHIPYDKVHPNDLIYFKEGTELISLQARVTKVIQFDDLNEKSIANILTQYGERIGITKDQRELYKAMFADKKYCVLIFLGDIKDIPPFQVSKVGYGNMASWITIQNIQDITVNQK